MAGGVAFGVMTVLSPPASSLRWESDLTCGGTYAAPTKEEVRSRRDVMVAATGGEYGLIESYLTAAARDRIAPNSTAEEAGRVLHQTALDYGLAFNGLLVPIRSANLASNEQGSLAIEYHTSTKWVKDSFLPVSNTVVMSVGYEGEDKYAINHSVDVAITDKNPFYSYSPRPPSHTPCPTSLMQPTSMKVFGYVYEG